MAAIWERLTEAQERKYNQLSDAFDAWGYFIGTEPIPGMEDIWLESMSDTLRLMEKTIARQSAEYKLRGRSKRAMFCLHSALPEPCSNVALRAEFILEQRAAAQRTDREFPALARLRSA